MTAPGDDDGTGRTSTSVLRWPRRCASAGRTTRRTDWKRSAVAGIGQFGGFGDYFGIGRLLGVDVRHGFDHRDGLGRTPGAHEGEREIVFSRHKAGLQAQGPSLM